MRWLCLLLSVCACACTGSSSFASSDFESNDEGWMLGGDANPTPELRATGGNPTGHICGRDLQLGDLWYYIAPSKYLGDASRVYGKRLTWNLKQDTIYQQLKGRDVILQGNGLSLVFNVRETPAKEWTAYQAFIDDSSGWKVDQPDFPNATKTQMQTVLKNVSSLRIRGEFADGPDSSCLDNVYFGVD